MCPEEAEPQGRAAAFILEITILLLDEMVRRRRGCLQYEVSPGGKGMGNISTHNMLLAASF